MSVKTMPGLFAAFAVVALNSGCLSIGGKVVTDNPETQSRLSSLEARVAALEQTVGTTPQK